MNLENFRKNWADFVLLGAGTICLVLADITADVPLAMLGCTAFIVMMFGKDWEDFVLLGVGTICLVLANITADMPLTMLGCAAFIATMISAVGKSIAEEIRKNGGARDA